MQRFLNVSEAPLNFSDDLNEIIDIEPPARWTRDDRHTAFSEFERFEYFPANANLLVGLGRKADPYGITDAFVKKDTKADRGFDRAAEGRTCFGYTEVQRIIDLLGHQAVSCHHTIHIRCLERNDRVAESEVLK